MDEARAERVKTAFAAALMHPVEEVRSFTTRAIDETVWAVDRALALRCANAIAAEAAIIDKALEAEDARSYGERREVREIMADAATRVCALFWEDGGVAEAAHATLDTSERIGAHTLKRLLMILGRVPQDQLAIAAGRVPVRVEIEDGAFSRV